MVWSSLERCVVEAPQHPPPQWQYLALYYFHHVRYVLRLLCGSTGHWCLGLSSVEHTMG